MCPPDWRVVCSLSGTRSVGFTVVCAHTRARGFIYISMFFMQRQWLQIGTGNSERYDRMGIQVGDDKAVIFEVDASNDAHVGFFTATRHYHAMYEIVISGWGNTQTVIRRRNQGPNMATANTRGLLRAGMYTKLWADAKDGLVRLGRGNVVGKRVILKWQDPRPLDVESVGLMTGWGARGKWRALVQLNAQLGNWQIKTGPSKMAKQVLSPCLISDL